MVNAECVEFDMVSNSDGPCLLSYRLPKKAYSKRSNQRKAFLDDRCEECPCSPICIKEAMKIRFAS